MAVLSAPQPGIRMNTLPAAHPMDSSQLFMTLLSLVKESEDGTNAESLKSIIAVPVLRRLLSAIHFRDAGTLKHSRRVGLISVGIAARLGWEEDDLRIIEIAALMHDIGKIGIPDHILRKPGKLSPDEAEYIAMYHRVALALLQACRIHPHVTEIISQSHGVDEETSLGRTSLGLGSRILAVADAYDSLTTRQCFRDPYDRWEALQILEEQSGKQFDRNVVAALGRWLDGPDAAALADERAAEVSIQVNAPIDSDTRMNAAQLCQIVNHLYLLESLYDAFYVVDNNRRVAIWSSGASALSNRTAHDTLGKKWSRMLICNTAANTDPLETVFLTGQPVCHGMTLQSPEGTFVDVDVQSIPVLDEQRQVVGVVELVCNCKESKRHRGQFRSLQMAATRDALTGVFNRGELERRLSEVHDAWENQNSGAFSIVFMDLDHFKAINDRISHAVGDRVLIECSRLLQDELYSGEVIGRYGGEEFLILCPETTGSAALERAERLRRLLSSTQFAGRDDLRVTASFGIAEIHPGESIESVVTRADQSLYEAKRQGRNRSCLCQCDKAVRQSASAQPAGGNESGYTATIQTYVAPEMLQLKLTGFIEEQKAKLLSVEPGRVLMQIGSANLFANWTRSSAERLPVKIMLEMKDANTGDGLTGPRRLILQLTITPLNRGTDAEAVYQRGQLVVEQLKSHLMAD